MSRGPSEARIHPSAVVEDGATLGQDVTVGPFCVVGAHARLDDGVELISHVTVAGRTRIGEGTRVWPFASLGHQPQDLKFGGEESRVEIGQRCMIREHVTVNPGTAGGGLVTQVGDGCLLMVGSHVAHDCRLGQGVILANNATLAGHVEVGDHAVLGGLSAVHQFVRIGAGSMTGGMSGVERDVIPYGTVIGNRAALGGLNVVGLKRRGLDRQALRQLREAYHAIFYGEGTLPERARAAAEQFAENEAVQQIAAFILAGSARKFCVPRDA